jgi:hypothetical protein
VIFGKFEQLTYFEALFILLERVSKSSIAVFMMYLAMTSPIQYFLADSADKKAQCDGL